MKMQITKDDIRQIVGKFIIVLDNDSDVKDISDMDTKRLDFFLEKHIYFVSIISDRETEMIPEKKTVVMTSLIDGFGSYAMTETAFIERFNNPNTKDTRHTRLLYNRELDVIFKWIKSKNY